MLLLSVLIVFALEYYFRWGSEYRQFSWFESFQNKLSDLVGEQDFYHGPGGVLLIILLPTLILGIVFSLLSGPLYWLLALPLTVAVLFYSLGPKSLEDTMERYNAAVERGDCEAGYLILKQNEESTDIPESEELSRNATRFILVESNKRYFGVVVWFLFFGPCGALVYRLAHQYHQQCINQNIGNHLDFSTQLIHWVDWVPARMTSIFNLLTGDFVSGFYRFKDYWLEAQASNDQLISETGIAALGLKMGYIEPERNENKEAMAMVMRTGIIYLVAIAILSPLSFW